ncbi:phosphate transporter 3;2 [Actinidia rufa]|uniref:Phosphate transporter 32 n=1 Tax=Actinidia rufa TaxID=165716 RepID=A0A7J0FZ06_9ERIC|nr:phosphate transporter 3;2 [Actinidia rufa]
MKKSFVIPAPSEPGKIEMYSPAYLAACAASGMLSTGLTHTAVTPLDVVKCNMQIDPVKSVISGFGVLVKDQGIQGLFRGWMPTLLGYTLIAHRVLASLDSMNTSRTDVALCPFEAVKVRVQTQPGFAKGLSDGLPKFVKSEGALGRTADKENGYYADTMMKFASFETIVELMYKHAIPTPKEECTSKTFQLGLSFVGGYIDGIFCAIVSHPADNLVSFLNNAEGATVRDAVNKLGVWGFFTRGLPLRIVMIGTLTGAQWGLYDAFKVCFWTVSLAA